MFACLHACLPHYHGIPTNITLFSPLFDFNYKKEILRKFSKLMKEISFKMRKNYEQNRKFCVVKVETLPAIFDFVRRGRSEILKELFLKFILLESLQRFCSNR